MKKKIINIYMYIYISSFVCNIIFLNMSIRKICEKEKNCKLI